MEKNLQNNTKGYRSAAIAFVVFVIAAVIFRIGRTTSRYDETFNLWVSACTLLGQRHLVDNPYIFQTGDLWNLPFLAIFYSLTGGFSGVVLFVRYCYLGINLLLAFLTGRLFRRCGKSVPVPFLAMLIPSFAFASIYSMSYDTAYLYFSLLASVLLSAAVWGSFARKRNRATLAFFAGVSYAITAYAYPTMLLLVLAVFLAGGIWLLHARGRAYTLRILAWVTAGGAVVFAVFLAYIACVGVENTILSKGLGATLAAEGRPMAGALGESGAGLLGMLAAVIEAAAKNTGNAIAFLLEWNKSLYAITLLLLLQWIVGLRSKKRWIRVCLLAEIVLLGFFAQWGASYLDYFDSIYAYAYYFFWAPLIFFYINERKMREIAMWLLCIGWFPALFGFAAVANTAVYAVKAPLGLYLGALSAILVFCLALRDSLQNPNTAWRAMLLLAGGLVVFNLAAFYHSAYEGAPWWQCTYTVKSGLLKGIGVGKEDAFYETLEKTAAELIQPEDKTVYCSPTYTGGYFWVERATGSFPDADIPREEWADFLILDPDAFATLAAQRATGFDTLYADNGCYIVRLDR